MTPAVTAKESDLADDPPTTSKESEEDSPSIEAVPEQPPMSAAKRQRMDSPTSADLLQEQLLLVRESRQFVAEQRELTALQKQKEVLEIQKLQFELQNVKRSEPDKQQPEDVMVEAAATV